MNERRSVYIQAFSTTCALGADVDEVLTRLFGSAPPVLAGRARLGDGREVRVGALGFDLPSASRGIVGRSRNNRLLTHAYAPVAEAMAVGVERFGAARAGVVIGTSTAGIAEGEAAVRRRLAGAAWDDPDGFRTQELSDPARAAATLSGALGPAYVVSTACTSGAKALAAAGVGAGDIGYVHLHGTGTRLNDPMEAALIDRLFGRTTPASSTKPLTGHTLGAAGALQAAFCLMAMARGVLPPHVWDGDRDPGLAPIRLVETGETAADLHYCYSASHAFGGNNAALILARD